MAFRQVQVPKTHDMDSYKQTAESNFTHIRFEAAVSFLQIPDDLDTHLT